MILHILFIELRLKKEEDMETIVSFIDEIITDAENEKKVAEIKQKVNDLMKSRPLFSA